MANKRNGALYIGVTTQLVKSVQEHRMFTCPERFTARHRCNILVYYNTFSSIEEAIAEGKRIKGMSRFQKLTLIENNNPEWRDLWDEIKELDIEVLKEIKKSRETKQY